MTSARILVARRYLLITAFISYQSLQNLLPDALLTTLLDGGEAMLEGVHVAWRSALSLFTSHEYP
jgi:hypothetical protein